MRTEMEGVRVITAGKEERVVEDAFVEGWSMLKIEVLIGDVKICCITQMFEYKVEEESHERIAPQVSSTIMMVLKC